MTERAVRPDDAHLCFVCGLDVVGIGENRPWGEDGISPTFEFCPCCGVEFGCQDVTLEACQASRSRWLESGGEWSEPARRPGQWSRASQLSSLPGRVRATVR